MSNKVSESSWEIGQLIKKPNQKFIQVDPQSTDVASIYRLMIAAIVPRPIAFVSTVNSLGQGNLAPFSFFNGVSSNPACIVISVTRKSNGEKKDTLINIEQSKQFVVNSANSWLIDPLVHCAGDYPYGVNELEVVGLTTLPSKLVKPFRVAESAMQMECEVYDTLEIGNGGVGSATLVVGKILMFHLSEEIYKDGKIDIQAFSPVARLGGATYCSIGNIFIKKIPEINS
jgi:flavin reductase (DIM6/NTAB) family NADH-FMN oxidoreductase RutF